MLPGGVGFPVGKMAPEAIAAVHRAGPGNPQQRAPLVFVEQARRRHGRQIAHGIGAEPRRGVRFAGQWQHLQQQGVPGVSRPHPGGIAAGHPQREFPLGFRAQAHPLWVEAQQGQQFPGLPDGVRQFPLPGAGRGVFRIGCFQHWRFHRGLPPPWGPRPGDGPAGDFPAAQARLPAGPPVDSGFYKACDQLNKSSRECLRQPSGGKL